MLATKRFQTVTLPAGLMERLRQEAKGLGVPLAWIVAALVSEARASTRARPAAG